MGRVKLSLVVTAIIGSIYIYGTFALAGFFGFICLFVIPQIVFNFWMSTFTLLHHTRPENDLMTEGVWTPQHGQLSSSVKVFFPKFVDWFTHDISWHVPHHVSVGVPHYHLREAHYALKREYPKDVQEVKFTWTYLMDVLKTCQFVVKNEEGNYNWTSLKGARKASRVEDHAPAVKHPI